MTPNHHHFKAGVWRAAFLIGCVATFIPAPAQTLFVPSGTSGIGSSANGYVGIGTSSPSQTLHVLGNVSFDGEFGGVFTGADQTPFNATGVLLRATTAKPHIVARLPVTDSTGAFSVYDSSSVALFRVFGDGNVVIGANYPVSSKFTLSGSATINGGLTNATAARPVVAPGTLSNGEIRGISSQGAGADDGFLRISAGGGTTIGVKSFIDLTGYSTVPSMNNLIALGTSGTERVRITDTGNVGIGTSTPNYPLSLGTGIGSKVALYDAGGGNGYGFGIQNNLLQIFANTSADRVGIGYGNSANFSETLTVKGTNVGIGTTAPTHKLAVNGTIRAKEVIVDTGWADHVFAADYRLAPLSEVEQHIQQNGHLPDVPSAQDVAARGVSVGEIQKILLQKIEELTLHQIEQEKRLNSQADRIRTLEAENAQLRQP